jgi:SAM-dependent methyltransferase
MRGVCSNVEQFVVAKAEDLSVFKEASFDAATGCYVLMFVDVSKALTELARVLKPGGLGFFSVWIDMPFYSLPLDALKNVFAQHGFKGDVPKPPVNPMALSPTEHGVSSVEAGLDGMVEKSLRIKYYEDISYEFYFGSMQDTCAATSVLFPGTFAKIAEDNGTTEAKVRSSFCESLTSIIESKPEWKKTDGSYSLGYSTARFYGLEKVAKKPEL